MMALNILFLKKHKEEYNSKQQEVLHFMILMKRCVGLIMNEGFYYRWIKRAKYKIINLLQTPAKYIDNYKIRNAKYSFSNNGLNKPARNPRVVISMTSFPARINYVPATIESLLNQTFKPDHIILWLAQEQFKDQVLPKVFERIRNAGVQIEFRSDLRSHKKYFFAMQEYPEDIIITVDDDVIYGKDTIKELMMSYHKFPHSISALNVRKITFNEKGELRPYNEWYDMYERTGTESFSYMAIGVGGVLYPPHCLHQELFNTKNLCEMCFFADDFWLKTMELLAGTRVAIAGNSISWVKRRNISGLGQTQLQKTNVNHGGNDKQIKDVLAYYNNWNYEGETLQSMMRNDEIF